MTILLLLLSALVLPVPARSAPQSQPAPFRLLVVESRAEAESLLLRIDAGGDIRQLALEHSIDPSGAAGGYIGLFRVDELRPELGSAAATLEPGEVSPLIPIPGGYALLERLDPTEHEWEMLRADGLAAVERGQLEAAYPLVDRALELAGTFPHPDSRLATSLNDRAELDRLSSRYDDAVGRYRRALDVWDQILGPGHPSTATTLNNLAEAHRLQGDHDEAAPLYREAVRLWEETVGPDHPNVATALNNLALVHQARGEFAEAKGLYARVLPIWESTLGPHPNVAAALNNLAAIHRAEGDYAESARLYERSLAIWQTVAGPNHANVAGALSNLAGLAELEEDYAEAIRLYERFLDVRWGRVPVDVGGGVAEATGALVGLLARAFVEDSRTEHAAARLDAALTRAAPAEELYLAMSNILREARLTGPAEALLAPLLTLSPPSRMTRYQLAELYADSGRLTEALAALDAARRSVGTVPSEGRILKKTGAVMVELNRLDDAARAYSDAAEIDPDDPEPRMELGHIRSAQGEAAEALVEYALAARLAPGSVDAQYHVADAHLRIGRWAEALDWADRALGLDPDHRGAHYVRGRALAGLGRAEPAGEALARYRQLGQALQQADARRLAAVVVARDASRLLAEGSGGGAMDRLEQGIAEYPESARLRLSLGLIQLHGEDFEAAVRTFQAMVDGGLGDDSLVRRSLAEAHRGLGDLEEGARHEAGYLSRIQNELEEKRPR